MVFVTLLSSLMQPDCGRNRQRYVPVALELGNAMQGERREDSSHETHFLQYFYPAFGCKAYKFQYCCALINTEML